MVLETGDVIYTLSLMGLGGAVAWIWRKVDNSASKQELKDAITANNSEIKDLFGAISKSNDEWRETARLIYANSDSDRQQNHDRFTVLQNELHRLHVDLLDRMSHRRGDDKE